MEISE